MNCGLTTFPTDFVQSPRILSCSLLLADLSEYFGSVNAECSSEIVSSGTTWKLESCDCCFNAKHFSTNFRYIVAQQQQQKLFRRWNLCEVFQLKAVNRH